MSRDDDVIELGADGSFDIQAKTVKQVARKDIDYSTYDWSQLELQQNLDLLQTLQVNEYAVYKRDDGLYWVMVKVGAEVAVQEVLFAGHDLRLLLSSQQKIDITLPSNIQIKVDSVQSKSFQGYVTIQFYSA